MTQFHGRFLWYELMTTDVEAAKAFYGDVIGWGTQAWEGGDMPYTMFTVGERPVGGLMTLPDEAQAQGAPPHWISYIGSQDVDATLEQAKNEGAQVYMEPMDLPSVGRMTVLADPQGATIAFYTPEQPTPPAQPGPGDFSWHELACDDPEAAWGFYHELFNWTKHPAMDMGPGGVYHLFGLDAEMAVGGMFKRPEQMPVSAWLYYVTVADLEGALERVKGGGGQVLNGPMEVPGGGRIAQCMDPQGGAFALYTGPQE